MLQNNLSKKINFWYANQDIKGLVGKPVPAKLEIPKWYKDTPKYIGGNELHVSRSGQINLGVKSCIPFLDAMLSGYIVKLHCDVLITEEDYGRSIFWKHPVSPMSPRPDSLVADIPNVPGYEKFSQAFEMLFAFKLPKGYSALITQPFNNFDLPTYVTSAIVDGEKGIEGGEFPFAFKEGFTGVIESGTPIFQIIPFKRENWDMNFNEGEISFPRWNDKEKISGWYKHNLWQKKRFE